MERVTNLNRHDAMIGKAKSIAHGVHALKYMNGESVHKKHPERIHHVTSRLLDEPLNALGIWDSMKLTASSHPRCKNIINNDHNIHVRAQKAAEAVAIKRGWMTPMKIREQNLEQVAQDCLTVLQEMPEWSWNSYIAKLKQKGYDVRLRIDSSKRKVVGYVLAKGNAKYKASELGKGRALTASRIETTWRKLRQQSATQSVTKPTPIIDYTRCNPNTTSYELLYEGEIKRFYIPDEAMQIFNDEFDYRETANWQELIQMSVALFVGLSGGVGTASSVGGGGNENDLPWGRDKDEDDREWARRCARRTARTIGIQKRGGMKR